MDDELQIKVEESETSNTTSRSASKRKAKDDIISLPNLNSDKRKRILKGPKSYEVREILKTDVFKFCQDIGLVARTVKCSCNGDMSLMSYPQTKDIFKWRCRKNGHSSSQTIRKGTFFEESNLSMREILWIVYMWLYEYSMAAILHECDHTYNTISEWITSFVILCREILELKCDPVGGDQKTVEVFECNFPKKNPSEKSSKKWVFCALEYDGTNSLFIILEDRKAESIMIVFDKYILPGTKLVSHVWSAFKNLTADNFDYLRDDRSISFYNLWSKMRINTFKDFKFVANTPLAGTSLWHKSVYDESFFEKMYRKSLQYAPDAYSAFLKDIALVYKPTDVCIKKNPKIDDK